MVGNAEPLASISNGLLTDTDAQRLFNGPRQPFEQSVLVVGEL
jgi:hypothetical protein